MFANLFDTPGPVGIDKMIFLNLDLKGKQTVPLVCKPWKVRFNTLIENDINIYKQEFLQLLIARKEEKTAEEFKKKFLINPSPFFPELKNILLFAHSFFQTLPKEFHLNFGSHSYFEEGIHRNESLPQPAENFINNYFNSFGEEKTVELIKSQKNQGGQKKFGIQFIDTLFKNQKSELVYDFIEDNLTIFLNVHDHRYSFDIETITRCEKVFKSLILTDYSKALNSLQKRPIFNYPDIYTPCFSSLLKHLIENNQENHTHTIIELMREVKFESSYRHVIPIVFDYFLNKNFFETAKMLLTPEQWNLTDELQESCYFKLIEKYLTRSHFIDADRIFALVKSEQNRIELSYNWCKKILENALTEKSDLLIENCITQLHRFHAINTYPKEVIYTDIVVAYIKLNLYDKANHYFTQNALFIQNQIQGKKILQSFLEEQVFERAGSFAKSWQTIRSTVIITDVFVTYISSLAADKQYPLMEELLLHIPEGLDKERCKAIAFGYQG